MSVLRAEAAQAAAESASESLRKRLEEAGAERRVLQDSVKSMRQECTERWVRAREGDVEGDCGRCAGADGR